jgi:PAS domain S-box-containing protein
MTVLKTKFIDAFVPAAEKAAERALTEQDVDASEERFRTLADNIAQLAWSADASGSILWYNQRWYDYTGTTFEQMRESRWQNLVHPDYAKRVAGKIARCFESGEGWEDTFPLRANDGDYRWFLSRAFPIRDPAGRIARWFGTHTDVTDQRAEEEALREADRHKTEFLAWLSHELRNPFGLVCTSMVVIQRSGTDSEQGRHALSVINRQITQMGRLLEDLLDVTRISKDKILLRRESVDLNELVRSVGADHRQLFEREGIHFEIELMNRPVPAYLDSARVTQIVGNLLLNAMKYTPNGGHVVLSVDASKFEGTIQVRDDGAGIAPGLIAKIFDPLVQDSRTIHRSRGGFGLGLFVVQGLVARLGGSVSASSDGPGCGSVFTVRLPLHRPRRPSKPVGVPPGRGALRSQRNRE